MDSVEENQPLKQNDIDIPENLEKYRNVIEKIEDDFEKVVKGAADGFDGGDVMLLVGAISRTISEMKQAVESLKEVDGDDRITIFNIITSLIIKKAILSNNNLSDEVKQQVESAFAMGGLVETILNAVRDSLKKVYKEMDVNNDNYVSKYEYQKYIEDSNMEKCGCCGIKSNKNCAKCFTALCFPILSCCNPKGIKIPK